jgi:hypothetical protein
MDSAEKSMLRQDGYFWLMDIVYRRTLVIERIRERTEAVGRGVVRLNQISGHGLTFKSYEGISSLNFAAF